MNHRSSVAVAAALVALTACTSTVDVPPLRPFGFLDLNTLTVSGRPSGFVAQGTAIFTQARITGVIGSGSLAEGCQQPTKIVPLSVRTTTPFQPGDVSITLHGNVDTTTRVVPLLQKVTAEGAHSWINDSLPNFSPGSDTVTFKATGVAGGFPPFSIRAPTVAPYTPQPVDDSVTGTGIRVQWTPSPNPSTAMQIALQYTDSASTTGYPNVEIICVARDDGDFTINRTFVGPWEQAGVDSLHVHRGVAFTRFLTTTSQVGDGFVTVVVRRDTTIVKE